ncbi:MAG TPA: alpha/beta fold hydrolase [Acidobacteriota bacterium]|nr:alpha/beta fold hydrolase [Acidobacteriota bacterium]
MKRKSIAKKTGKIFLYTLGAITGAFSAGALLGAWTMIRPGRKRDYDCIGHIAFGKLEPISLIASDDVRLHAWVQRSSKATSNRWVILLHGYRSDRLILQSRRNFFVRRGYHTLLLHFRGHGSSEAANISYGFQERLDVKAAFDFIRSSYAGQPVQIGIDGVSMGAAAAVFAVSYESIHPDWVILESCYDNIDRALTNRLRELVYGAFVPLIARPLEFAGKHVFHLPLEDLNPQKALGKILCPVLVLAGDSEKVLKAAEVEQFYQGIPEPKRLVFFPGAAHEDLLMYDPRRFNKAVSDFLRDFSPSLEDSRKPSGEPTSVDAPIA